MNRREFIAAVIATPILAAINPPVSWVHPPTGNARAELIALIKKLMDDAIAENSRQIDKALFTMHGIPYYENDALYRNGYFGIDRKAWL